MSFYRFLFVFHEYMSFTLLTVSSAREVNEAAAATNKLSVRVHDFANLSALQLKELCGSTTGLHALQDTSGQAEKYSAVAREPSLCLKTVEYTKIEDIACLHQQQVA